ncbi:hypothetical protein SAMN05421756_106171 [Microlunatus flavus]|uniref:Uncharacterized protein n=1 Tax=Microlunatus flavus TaxID=1036181 RepID=A0A1H9JDY0_9ACTN|nr:hypothetical protein SAMN05421756_106171 [Microlunatus flavus]
MDRCGARPRGAGRRFAGRAELVRPVVDRGREDVLLLPDARGRELVLPEELEPDRLVVRAGEDARVAMPAL